MERVFRISKWSSAFGKSSWHLKKKYLFDDLTDYKRRWKSLKRLVERSTDSRIRVKISGEEFVNGSWVLLEIYPEEE